MAYVFGSPYAHIINLNKTLRESFSILRLKNTIAECMIKTCVVIFPKQGIFLFNEQNIITIALMKKSCISSLKTRSVKNRMTKFVYLLINE